MPISDDLLAIAQEIQSFEAEGAALSDDWYRFERGTTEDLEQLKRLADQSFARLTTLADRLQARLRQQHPGPERERLQHAYELTQELLQSRAANRELLEDMLAPGDAQQYFEFFRALAIKEQAAKAQAEELTQLLSSQ
ncbi:hypothetical protein JI721_00560 [Alicyclobacillus cycloheptanicus]|uniref:Uncharacterized protein n=1 Tax=Alicyclobacillus cycloheptanicus TaxID=1457 RepID=A0ABT9XJV8_9BACL|nr:hypothetical protein [Alicyclobacillus cycloheptanicus]MDQ0190587.1 hypothetical protein [Alicyclobacillus cycloheptanicus]WDM01424.1 hypothetical protein JI721_00560 [Alicyclobacillus cycloheptanicus]